VTEDPHLSPLRAGNCIPETHRRQTSVLRLTNTNPPNV